MYQPTLSIDLGASYTKIAYRPACTPKETGTVRCEAKVVMVDGSPMIPSFAVYTRNPAKPWIFGREAAGMKPNKEMQVFQNWKADLFRPHNDRNTAAASIIANRFFEWLRSKLEDSGINVRKCQTRVAMPAFETFDQNAFLIARCLDLSGWNDPTLILKVREPHANVLGLLSLGKNIVMKGENTAPTPNYGKMFGHENPYIQAARGFTLYGSHGNLLTVMAVDIGAFTTDLAQMTFDFTEPADGLRAIKQKSFQLGVIDQLDRPFFRELELRHGFSWTGHTFFEQEECKTKLYQGEGYPLQTFVKGAPKILELGTPEDIKAVAQTAGRLATSIWSEVAAFSANEKPSIVFLTGGGNLIKPISEMLRSEFAKIGVKVIRVNDAETASGSGTQVPWNETGESLQRLATTIGGASVILQEAFSADLLTRDKLRQSPPIVTAQPEGFRTCRCQGANKDCCFCGGRGFY